MVHKCGFMSICTDHKIGKKKKKKKNQIGDTVEELR